MSLPSGYTQLEYIESTGTQYIDTGFVPNQDTRVVIKAKCPVSSSTNFLFGARTSSSSNQFMFAGSASGYYVSGYGSASKSYSAAYNSDSAIVIDKNKQTTTLTLSDGTSTSVSGTYATFSAPCNLVLFGCNTNGTVAKGSVTIFSCQIYDNGTLVRDYIPCETDTGEIGLWDAVNSVFYGNAGTGTFSGKVEGALLPIGYTQLTYIESSGTQYIDTGFAPNQDTRLVIKAYFPLAGSNRFLYGARTAEKSNGFALNAYSTKYRSHYNNNWIDYATSVSFDEPFTIDQNKNVTTLNDEYTVTGTYAAFTSPCSLTLFAINNNGTVATATRATAKIYFCQIYDNGTLVRDYIPCLNASGEAGLWDAVNSVFYTNAGSGEFTHNLIPAGDHNANIGGIAAATEGGTVLFGGVSREIDSGITLVGGVAREIAFVTGEPIGNLAVGASVYTPVNGVIKEFIVVHQGKPSSMYDSSCNGTWLLSKDIYTTSKWHSTTYNAYKSSTIHTYLKNTFLNLLDDDIKAQIKTVKIPYINQDSSTGHVKIESGSNGLSVQIFLLSVYEVGFTSNDSSYIPDADGAKLDYFGSGTDSTSLKKRIAYLNGTANTWWLRTAYTFNASSAWSVNASGRHAGDVVTASKGVRPALILPQSALVNSSFQIIG